MTPKTISGVVVISGYGVGKTNLISQFIKERVEGDTNQPPALNCTEGRIFGRAGTITAAKSIRERRKGKRIPILLGIRSHVRYCGRVLGYFDPLAQNGKVFLVGILADAQDQGKAIHEDGEGLAREFGVGLGFECPRAATVEELFQDITRFALVKQKIVEEKTHMWEQFWKRICS